jgi:hypothetical protein
MFYPNYKSITDYSVFEKFMFLSIPSIEEEVPMPMPVPILKEKEMPVPMPMPMPITPILKEKEIPIQTRLEKECLFAKNVQDGLFWAMYIANYGYNEYNRNKYNYGKVEVQEKEKIAEYLHNNKNKTNYKLTRGFCCEIESDLITKPKMPFSGLIGMCAMYSCNIAVVDLNKKIYYLFLSSQEEDLTKTYILYKNPLPNKSNEYFVDIDHKIYYWTELKDRFFKIENYQKPMKSITNYKKTELEYIVEKLNINRDGKEDKHQLYEKIIIYLSTSTIL